MARYPEPHRTTADQLWEAICEGRRLDAYELLCDVARNEQFLSLSAMHRIRPDKIAPPNENDRAR